MGFGLYGAIMYGIGEYGIIVRRIMCFVLKLLTMVLISMNYLLSSTAVVVSLLKLIMVFSFLLLAGKL